MAPKLYIVDSSSPVRAVLLTAKALDVELELIRVDMSKGEHLKPEFLKMNPQHTVPTLDDNGFIIWDSHAINIYLVSKYGKDDFLYPNDVQKRAIINQRLHFDSGALFPTGLNIFKPIVWEGEKTVPPEKSNNALDIYGFLEKFLEGHQWAAGDSVTLADLSLLPSVTTICIVVPIEESKFPNITAWIKRAQGLPYYGANQEGLEKFTSIVLSKLNS